MTLPICRFIWRCGYNIATELFFCLPCNIFALQSSTFAPSNEKQPQIMVTPETLYLSFNFSNRLFTPGSALEFERHHFGPGMVLLFLNYANKLAKKCNFVLIVPMFSSPFPPIANRATSSFVH